MAEHENSVGASDEWYTPPEIFDALGVTFDLDPCAPPSQKFWCVPAVHFYTKVDDGLTMKWFGGVFVNPPFGGRRGHLPWLRRFIDHGYGIMIVRAYTSSDWWHEYIPKIEVVVFPRGKTQFIRGTNMMTRSRTGKVLHYPAGTRGTSPGHGIALLGLGERACKALKKSGLGMVWDRRLEV